MSDMRLSEDASHPAIAASTPCVKIDKGVPIPPIDRSRAGSRKKDAWLPFRRMQIGDSFIHPSANAARAGAAVSEASRRMPATFLMRTVEENGERIIRVWRVA